MQCKTPKTSQRPQKPRQGDQLIHRGYTKSSPQEPNFSFRFGARSISGKVKPGRQRGGTVAVGDDGGRVVVQEYKLLAEAAECTEFPKLEGALAQCPIASDALDSEGEFLARRLHRLG